MPTLGEGTKIKGVADGYGLPLTVAATSFISQAKRFLSARLWAGRIKKTSLYHNHLRDRKSAVARFVIPRQVAGSWRYWPGMKPNKVRLFVKPFCGWCHEAEDWLEERGVEFEKLDVISDRSAREEMLELSGQTLAPVIDVDGEILADFDTDQLEEFWKKLEKSAA